MPDRQDSNNDAPNSEPAEEQNLPDQQLDNVAGGFNPQPDPPAKRPTFIQVSNPISSHE